MRTCDSIQAFHTQQRQISAASDIRSREHHHSSSKVAVVVLLLLVWWYWGGEGDPVCSDLLFTHPKHYTTHTRTTNSSHKDGLRRSRALSHCLYQRISMPSSIHIYYSKILVVYADVYVLLCTTHISCLNALCGIFLFQTIHTEHTATRDDDDATSCVCRFVLVVAGAAVLGEPPPTPPHKTNGSNSSSCTAATQSSGVSALRSTMRRHSCRATRMDSANTMCDVHTKSSLSERHTHAQKAAAECIILYSSAPTNKPSSYTLDTRHTQQ